MTQLALGWQDGEKSTDIRVIWGKSEGLLVGYILRVKKNLFYIIGV